MTCQCQTCLGIRHLRECGVSEDFMERWLDDGMDSEVNKSILDGTWPNAVECLKTALERATMKLEETK